MFFEADGEKNETKNCLLDHHSAASVCVLSAFRSVWVDSTVAWV